MRRFRFVGDPSEYGDTKPVVGQDYDEHTIETKWGTTGCSTIETFPNEWQEVYDKPMITDGPVSFTKIPTPLHKDTDLGYFAGLAMQGILANDTASGNHENMVKASIILAKELIKQLNEETR